MSLVLLSLPQYTARLAHLRYESHFRHEVISISDKLLSIIFIEMSILLFVCDCRHVYVFFRCGDSDNFVSLNLLAISFGEESAGCIYLTGKHGIDLRVVPSELLLKVRNTTGSVFCAHSCGYLHIQTFWPIFEN